MQCNFLETFLCTGLLTEYLIKITTGRNLNNVKLKYCFVFAAKMFFLSLRFLFRMKDLLRGVPWILYFPIYLLMDLKSQQ